ncbi:hypothetical protein AAG747_28180 [Rapidithrix thailandica]|uniref:Uncharacterized protein n=1 Tax=Rapidithrix thailandica TaxID=413964 RepID=A0AAW9SEN7_9BACT
MKSNIFYLFILFLPFLCMPVFAQTKTREIEVGYDENNNNLFSTVELKPDFLIPYRKCRNKLGLDKNSTVIVVKLAFIRISEDEVTAKLIYDFDDLVSEDICIKKMMRKIIRCKVKVVSFPAQMIDSTDTLAMSYFVLKVPSDPSK